MSLKVLYLCDPEKNTGCEKTCCKHNPNAVWPVCDSTSNVEYTKTIDKGTPIVSMIYCEEG